jgi:hypothetical protein
MGSMAISATGVTHKNRLKKVREAAGKQIGKAMEKAVKKAEKNLQKNLRNSTIFHTFAYEKTYPTRDVFL